MIIYRSLGLLTFWVASTVASHGDDLFIFDDCVYQCQQLSCHNNVEYKADVRDDIWWDPTYVDHWEFDKVPLPWYLTALGWTCNLNCDYQCQRILTEERHTIYGDEVLQYHGKWPFWRVFGVQELASAVLSLGNFIPHFVGARKILRILSHKRDTEPQNIFSMYFHLYINVLVMTFITMCAWLASTVFHVRDFKVTEKLDYFLAGLTVLSGFHTVAQRVFKLYLPGRFVKLLAVTAACILGYSGHVTKLLLDWLYTYNMQANVAVALLQNFCWCMLCYDLYSQYYYLEIELKGEAEEAEEEEEKEKKGPAKAARGAHLKYAKPSRIILSSFFTTSPKLFRFIRSCSQGSWHLGCR